LKSIIKIKQNKQNTNMVIRLIRYSEIIVEYELKLQILKDTFLLTHRKFIHIKIIKPKKLFNNLKEIYYIINNKQLPVSLQFH